MIGDNQELSERIKDKNDLLETKDFKNNEVLNQIDQLHTQIDMASNRIEIQVLQSDFLTLNIIERL